jgi:hypothetical protein
MNTLEHELVNRKRAATDDNHTHRRAVKTFIFNVRALDHYNYFKNIIIWFQPVTDILSVLSGPKQTFHSIPSKDPEIDLTEYGRSVAIPPLDLDRFVRSRPIHHHWWQKRRGNWKKTKKRLVVRVRMTVADRWQHDDGFRSSGMSTLTRFCLRQAHAS